MAMDCAWMLDGVTKDRVYALSLASRTVSLGIKRGRKGYRLGLWQQRTIGSSKCLWGSCFHVGQELTLRLTVAAGGLLPTSRLPT
ncbi:hypothetical protein PIB30_065257 [Stylosanthes scabra]|uniref:Uncharacterized protein n=1 Tax=Stylosanthes scabra TaxID=79078 RepID=A0ABU6SM18_9FABA|nr:hypothetical protein [Stylosanthes scabra]